RALGIRVPREPGRERRSAPHVRPWRSRADHVQHHRRRPPAQSSRRGGDLRERRSTGGRWQMSRSSSMKLDGASNKAAQLADAEELRSVIVTALAATPIDEEALRRGVWTFVGTERDA